MLNNNYKAIKSLILVLFMAISVFTASADSVWGLEKLALKNEIERSIRDRFGYLNYKDKGAVITVINPTIGGVEFNFCDIVFNLIGGESRFNQIWFEKVIVNDSVELAEETVGILADNLKKKYGENNVFAYTNDEGFTSYGFCGEAINDIIGFVDIRNNTGRDGIKRLYLVLYYYPFQKDAVFEDL